MIIVSLKPLLVQMLVEMLGYFGPEICTLGKPEAEPARLILQVPI